MKIYLAGRYGRRGELLGYAEELRALGHEVTSRWLNGSHQVTDDGMHLPGTHDQAAGFAIDDVEDLLRADLCISFTEPPRSSPNRGGRHVEFGLALSTMLTPRLFGRMIGCVVVGHRENVFHCLPQVVFCETWLACLEWLCAQQVRIEHRTVGQYEQALEDLG